MRVDAAKSSYHERDDATQEFTRQELRRLRLLLRRLRFLEDRLRASGGLTDKSGSSGAAFVEWEVEALEWVLDDVGYLQTRTPPRKQKRS